MLRVRGNELSGGKQEEKIENEFFFHKHFYQWERTDVEGMENLDLPKQEW